MNTYEQFIGEKCPDCGAQLWKDHDCEEEADSSFQDEMPEHSPKEKRKYSGKYKGARHSQ